MAQYVPSIFAGWPYRPLDTVALVDALREAANGMIYRSLRAVATGAPQADLSPLHDPSTFSPSVGLVCPSRRIAPSYFERLPRLRQLAMRQNGWRRKLKAMETGGQKQEAEAGGEARPRCDHSRRPICYGASFPFDVALSATLEAFHRCCQCLL